jgi:hypothetical protein
MLQLEHIIRIDTAAVPYRIHQGRRKRNQSTSTRRYNITGAATVDEVTGRVKEGFAPIIKRTPGLMAFYLADAGGGGSR